MKPQLHRSLIGVVGSLAFLAIATSCVHAQSVTDAAAQIGVTPEALVIADVSTQEAEVILTHLASATDELTALAAADATLTQRTNDVSVLRASVQANPGDSELEQQLASALQLLATAREAMEDAQADLALIAFEGLGGMDVQRIVAFADSTGCRVPPWFRVDERTDVQWRQIERALLAEARSERLGTEMPSAYASLLADIRSDPDVAAAKVRYEMYLTSMQQVFEEG